MMIESILTVLIQQIASRAVEELMLAVADDGREVYDCFREMEGVFRLLRTYLERAEAVRARTKSIDEWVAILTKEAYEVEDLFDMFLALIQSHMRGGLIGFGHKFAHFPVESTRASNIATDVKKVRGRIDNILKQKETFDIPKLEDVCKRESDIPLELPSFDEGEDIVGIDRSKEQIIEWLTSSEQQRKVVSIWGMGGLGKTTLVRTVYNDPEVTKLFTVRAWVCITKTYNIDDLLRSMVHEIKQEAGNVHELKPGPRKAQEPESSNASEIPQLLAEKRYLIILDDVWDANVFRSLSRYLPDKNNGSRILVTTRDQDVASFASGNSKDVLNISPLTDEHARMLFHKNAFGNATCPQELDQWAQRIIDKCKGWPLALVVIGRVMASKPTTEIAWKDMFERLEWELSNNEILEGTITRVLMLSYKSLSYPLQRCFSYCSLFKEGHMIKTKWLIRMWIAEGFIVHQDVNNKMTLEEIGNCYIEQLAARSMLQIVKKDALGRPKACQVHDIMRNMVLTASRGENVCVTTSEQITRLHERCRRLSIMTGLDDSVQLSNHLSHIRTLLVSNSDPSFSLQKVCVSLKFLRVLELRGAPIHSVPNSVFDLFNLRYLGLRKTNVRKIPSTLEKLYNLQTLNLRDTKVKKLPRAIVKLRYLRHLYMDDIRPEKLRYLNLGRGLLRGREAPSGISDLTDLQTLRTIRASEQTLIELASLTQLRDLGVTNLDARLGSTLCNSISKMEKLSGLYITAYDGHPLMLDGLSAPPADLHKLILNCQLLSVPIWFSSLNNLTRLVLIGSCLVKEDNPVPPLGSLPNLVHLVLFEAYQGGSLCFEAGAFKRLETLFLWFLAELSEITVQEGGLPSLKHMHLSGLTNLKTVGGMQHITGIQTLNLLNMPTTSMFDPSEMQHIPSVKHIHSSPDGFEEVDVVG